VALQDPDLLDTPVLTIRGYNATYLSENYWWKADHFSTSTHNEHCTMELWCSDF